MSRWEYAPLSFEAAICIGSQQICTYSIDTCVFSNGADVAKLPVLTKLSDGLAILSRTKLLNISITIFNVISTRNVATMGTNFLFVNIASINITNITSSMANYLLTIDEALQMAGFTFSYSEMDSTVQVPTASKTLLHISDSRFYDNNGGGFHFQLLDRYSYGKYQVIIKNCSLKRNVNPAGSGFDIFHTSIISCKSDIEVLVEDTSFTNHNIVISEPNSLKQIAYQINISAVKN